MRYWYQKDDSYKNIDLTVNYLGYWTDNGKLHYPNSKPPLPSFLMYFYVFTQTIAEFLF